MKIFVQKSYKGVNNMQCYHFNLKQMLLNNNTVK